MNSPLPNLPHPGKEIKHPASPFPQIWEGSKLNNMEQYFYKSSGRSKFSSLTSLKKSVQLL